MKVLLLRVVFVIVVVVAARLAVFYSDRYLSEKARACERIGGVLAKTINGWECVSKK